MPLYPYKCVKCECEVDQNLPIEERNKVLICSECGGKLKRHIVAPAIKPKGEYQMKAILGDGTKIAGHFDKEAPLRRKK